MDRSVLGTVGSPLVQVSSPSGAVVAAKVESANPGGSAKDRPALSMVERLEDEGRLDDGDRLVEASSGNTGIGLAMVAAAKGYDLTVVMPASKSAERRRLVRAYGAAVELVDGDVSDARERADELEERGAIRLRQFENPANPEAHYETTGAELLEQVGDRTVDAFVAGVGTGGTISGVGRRLREGFPDVEIVAVEPADNAVLSGDVAPGDGEDAFQGMGPGFVSPNLDRDLLDEVETVTLDDAQAECRRLAREEGLLVGQSSGAASVVARQVADRLADADYDCPGPNPSANPLSSVESTSPGRDCPLVLTVFWDSGERYMSTGMFD